MPFNIQGPELIVILVIALLILGPGKLPEVGAALGKSIREFRKAASDVKDSASLEPQKPDAAATTTTQPAAAPQPATPAPPAPAPAGLAAVVSGEGPTNGPAPEPVATAPAASDTDSPAS